MSLKIDAIHFTFKQPLAARMAQKSFLDNYIESKILCIVDKGGENPNLGNKNIITKFLDHKISANSNGLYLKIDQLEKFLDYLMLACNLRKESDWIFILEDDVKVFKPLQTLSYDFNGINSSERFRLKVRLLLLLQGYSLSKSSKFGGCGGTIIHKKVIIKFSKIEWLRKLELYFKVWGRSIGSDELLTLMAVLSHSSIGPYDGFVETWYPDYINRLEKEQIVTLHKFKDFYLK